MGKLPDIPKQEKHVLVGFLRGGGVQGEGGNWGTLRIPTEDWAPLKIPIMFTTSFLRLKTRVGFTSLSC